MWIVADTLEAQLHSLNEPDDGSTTVMIL